MPADIEAIAFGHGLPGWRRFVGALGPGLVVMLADTETGSVITATQSGAQWGYRLLLLQLLLIPLLFVVQELAVRLGLGTGKGFAELIVERFGRGWAAVATLTLVVSCFGALITQLSGLAGVGQVFGVPVTTTVSVTVGLLMVMVMTGSYHSVERMAIGLGLCELAFLVVAWKAAPESQALASEILDIPWGDHGYLYLVAANIGTSVMPWTVFYQQSALVDKGLRLDRLGIARIDTLIGAVLCQAITGAVLVAAAATLGREAPGMALDNVPEVAAAFTGVLGDGVGRIVFAVGLGGGALVATIVVCLAAAWALGEVSGRRHSLEHHPLDAPWFYLSLGAVLVAGGAVVASGVNMVRLSIAVGVANAILLPIILVFLFRLARLALPAPLRLEGAYAAAVAGAFALAAGLGVGAGLFGVIG